MLKAKILIQTCILDILWHLPRSLFSDVQLQVILWGLSVLSVDNVPSTRILKDIDSTLQSQYGIPSVHYQGALGHIYYVNHLPSIIAQEMANLPSRWLYEIDPTVATPMICKGWQDFYVFELMKFPFLRLRTMEVWVSQFLLSFPHLLQTYWMDGQPDPRNIIETRGCSVLPWTLTNPAVSNRWHMLAWGHHVLSYMMWLYCDDTSGNTLKKWNKHNSFLFTAARLPCVMVHKESSIHFLATSNIAPPLEMLDGIVDQLEYAQMHGVWAWDIEAREMALVIPAVLVMLGDNPMQSELACHVGLQGKYFCHNCWVHGAGADSSQRPDLAGIAVTNSDNNAHSIQTGSVATDSDGSLHRDVTHQSKCKGCCSETMQDLVDRARHFLGMKTDTGIKDTYMDVFVECILKHVKGIHAGLDRYTEAFMSPVWRIKGLDPHQETPVEILHVILLGFLKYFWHDAISRLNDAQKVELQVQLASFDITGLGIPPLAGQTLVAPFILYDLIPRECYEAFLALSALVPLVWQPCIDNIDEHLAVLQVTIDHFLNCTAHWTPWWFNKPKFHIIRHLPDHIRRFGPAILFATEGAIRDITHRMAQCHHVRHLLSGGKFHAWGPVNDEQDWLMPGSGVESLVNINIPSFCNVIADYFGLIDEPLTLEAELNGCQDHACMTRHDCDPLRRQ
ncbi:hypothetical protein EDC04DRAFT_2874144 [Pisolithus marmoratus]|nr:hypothetical protein EDC04DRAFT_2874144 [Pisolithus marmoratus]